MKRFLLATVSMVALTNATRAADMPAKAPLYAPGPLANWTGAYIGVQGGVVRRDLLFKDSAFDVPTVNDGSKTGGIAGVLAGYNWQQGRFVYGVESDWSWIGAKRNFFHTSFFSTSYNVNWLATVRGRAGIAVDSTLFYLTGGAAFGHVNNRFDDIGDDGGIFFSLVQDQTKVGWTVGTGVEHMFAPQWTARAEFRYVNLGKSEVGQINCVNPVCSGYRGEFSNALMMGLVGLTYKFGGGRAADWSQARAYTPPSVPAWAGAYLGIQGGVARHDAFFDDSDCFLGPCSLIDHRKAGGTVGGLLGHNWQKGSFVYGVEGDWSRIGAKTSRFTPDTGFEQTSLSTSYDVNWLATLRGRAGLALDLTMLYVTGGVALGHVKNSVVHVSGSDGNFFGSFTQNQTKVGWTAGVGAEYMLSPHWTARAEFRYVDLGRTTIACSSATNFNSCVSSGFRGDFSNTLKLGLVGLAYKF